jgi:hypothetical protein
LFVICHDCLAIRATFVAPLGYQVLSQIYFERISNSHV